MASKLSNPPPGFDELTVEKKLDYLESLCDRITDRPDAVPVPDWHLEVIEERLNKGQAGSQVNRSWDNFRDELRAKLRQREPAP